MRVGLDVGGTKILGVLLDESNSIVAEERIATSQDLNRLIEDIAQLVQRLDPSHAGPVGIGVPGPVNISGTITAAPNLACLAGSSSHTLSNSIGVDIQVENDAKCATLAEWRVGAGEGCRDFVLVTIGTGIGAGVVAEGSLVRGRHGFAGEFGHTIVQADGPRCGCGQRGCWEQLASGSALTRRAEDAFQAGWFPTPAAARRIQGEDLVELARSGDERAHGAVMDHARWLALGLINLANLLDPEKIVLAGGVSSAADVFLPAIGSWTERLWNGFGERAFPAVVPTSLGPSAGAVGAALLGVTR